MKQSYRYEYEKNSAYKYAKQDTINYILDKSYGETLTYKELGKFFNFNVDNEDDLLYLKFQMRDIKNVLIDYGYVLKTVVGIGYYILKPKQISGYCYHAYIRKTEKLLNKSDRILAHVDKSELSETRTQEHKEVCQLNRDVANSIETTIYNSDYEANKYIYENLDD